MMPPTRLPHTHTKQTKRHLCPSPLLCLLSQSLLLLLFLFPSPLFPPLLQLPCHLPLLLLSPKTEENRTQSNRELNSSFSFCSLLHSISSSRVLLGLALGLPLPAFCLLLTLYPGLAFLMFASFPPLNSLGII